MQSQRVNLVDVFQTVTKDLEQNQLSLNQADEYNHDHGSNMVQTFQTITNALEKKRGGSDSAALAYAARMVARNSSSSSSRLYAENLNQAAMQFKRKRVDEQSALQLLQTLIGSTQTNQPSPGASSQADSGDMLGALLGGLVGEQPASQADASPGGDMLSMLLSGLSGQDSTTNQQSQGGFTMQNLLAGGMAFLQARQGGSDNMQALIQAFSAASNMGSAEHRQQSTQVVVQAFLQALRSMNRKN